MGVCLVVTQSCKKETISTTNAQEIKAGSISEAVTTTTNFGVLPHDLKGDDQVTFTQELGLSYVRDQIITSTFSGKAPMFDTYTSNGIKVLCNLNYSAVKPSAFPTDMTKYKSQLENILQKYKPEVAVIENEPANDGYYTGPIENYFTELSTAISVCHSYGVKVSDGALHTGMVMILVYQNYLATGQQAKADDFAARALSSQYLRAAQGKGSSTINAKLETCKKMIAKYKTLALDYVNLHWYEPWNDSDDPSISAPGVAKEVADYLRTQTGKQVLTNEFGQTNQIPTLVASQVDEFRAAGFAYAIDFSGKSGGGVGAVPLSNGLTLLPNGIAYKDAVAQ